jgi:hypothetical protein
MKFIDSSFPCVFNNNYSEGNSIVRFLVDEKNESENLEKKLESKTNSLNCFLNSLCSYLVLLILLCTLICTYFFTLASTINYPGGVALDSLLTKHIPQYVANFYPKELMSGRLDGYKFSVHIDAATAMSGVTLFGQENRSYIHPRILNHDNNYVIVGQTKFVSINYSKEEGLKDFIQFDYLLTENYR